MDSAINDKLKLKIYNRAEKLWNSENISPKEMAEAWRIQHLILSENTCVTLQPSLLQKHQQKIQEKSTHKEIEEHIKKFTQEEIAQQLAIIVDVVQTKPASVGVSSKKKRDHHCSRKFSRKPMAATMSGTALISRNAYSTHENVSEQQMGFRSATELMGIQNSKKNQLGQLDREVTSSTSNDGARGRTFFNFNAPKSVLATRSTGRLGFVPPGRQETAPSAPSVSEGEIVAVASTSNDVARLANIDPKMITMIRNEIVHQFKPIDWQDIAGLSYAKSLIKEAIVFPLLRPDIFTGLRRPPRGMLLFGPPGTGKTMIGKCIASQSAATFFSISASSLTSKWVGEGEKMVRALFAVAAVHQPSVIFIDEIDSLLTKRSEHDHESSLRIKTEFLVQFDGATTSEEDRVIVIGATNRPQELDEAARRRFVKRLYVPLPDEVARVQILSKCLQDVSHNLTDNDLKEVGELTTDYSGADMDALCREASMEPIRSIPMEEMLVFRAENVRPIGVQDFRLALQSVRPTVSQKDLDEYIEWNRLYGAVKQI